MQSVELFYGLIWLAIVRVYTIEKQSAAPPESENSTSQTFTTLGKLNIQWAEKKRLGSLGRIQALETWLKLTLELGEVFIFCGKKKEAQQLTGSVARLDLAVNFNETCVTLAAKSVLNGAFISVVVTVVASKGCYHELRQSAKLY